MVISRRNDHGEHLEVDNFKFERVHSFKYLEVTVNSTINYHEEIKIRTVAANKCYYSLANIFKSKQVSLKFKTTLHKFVIRPVILYACETWPTTKGDEEKIAILQKRILKRIYGPRKNNETGQYKIRNNIELRQLHE